MSADRFRIYILDDESITVRRLVHTLSKDGYDVEGFTTAAEAMERLRQLAPDLMIVDVRLKDADGLDFMQRLKKVASDTMVILMTGYATVDHAVEAMKKGAFTYLAKPFQLSELRNAVKDAENSRRCVGQKDRLARELSKTGRFGEIIGTSPAMQDIFMTIKQVAPLNCNVLIQGESGTGKELVARSLHRNSPRAEHPFVPFNCGAFTEDLVANELFGHEKGAFTGAVSTKLGLLETANGGTIFLDEVAEMPLSMQIRLLRVIQERTFYRVGGVSPLSLDVRFIAAANRNFEKMIEAGAFRQDLYYRLKVVMIDLPPLRRRPEDIEALVAHFAAMAAKEFGKPLPAISADFMAALIAYPFPGNVRELQHIIEAAVAMAQGKVLSSKDLPPDLFLVEDARALAEEADPSLKMLEQSHIFDVYRRTGFNQSETARQLGISRTTLWRRLKEFGRLAPDSKADDSAGP
jgi:DNA-binding NtrC family response regulator